MSDDNKSPTRLSRRHVFAGAGAAGALAAAAVMLPKAGPAPQVAAAPEPQPAAPEQGGGYRETEHVRHYYRTARI